MSFMKLLGKAGKVVGKAAEGVCEMIPGFIEKGKVFFDDLMSKNSNIPVEIGEPVQISIIAPSRFGKTSLISCIYQEIEEINKPKGMFINTDKESENRLENFARATTDMIVAEKNISEIAIADAIGSTSDRNVFSFNIELKAFEKNGKNQIERVLKQGYKIQDIPGGWINGAASAEQKAQFEDFLKDSTILYIPIDATVLMSADTDEEKEIAASLLEIGNVRNIVFKWLNYNRNRECSIFFIPIKCEYYLKKTTTAEKLKQKVMEKYGEIYRKVQDSGTIKAYYVPVETLGCVEFAYGSWNKEKESFEAHFTTKGGAWNRKEIDKLVADIFKHSAWAIKDGIQKKRDLLEDANLKDKLTNADLKDYKKALKIIERALNPMIETFKNTYDKDLIESYRV